MHDQKVIGLDMGGTKIHLGLVQNGVIRQELKLPTPAQGTQDQIVAAIIAGIAALLTPDVAGIGIGVPGLVDEENGIVYNVQNIPAFREVPLQKHLTDYFQKPVFLTNDANGFVLGEKLYGRAQHFKNIVGLTLGTGFGAGIVVDHKLYSGTLSSAGEFGGVPYRDKTLEDYCSGKFFLQQFGLSGHEVAIRAGQHDAQAVEILNQFGAHLGNAIKIILYAVSPEAIFLGGSVSAGYPFFAAAMHQSIADFPFERVRDRLLVERSTINNVAILGAAALVHLNLK